MAITDKLRHYRHGIDLQAAMERCEERNRARGRYDGEQAVR